MTPLNEALGTRRGGGCPRLARGPAPYPAEEGSAEREILMAEVKRLQDEYFWLREGAFRHGRNMPPMPLD